MKPADPLEKLRKFVARSPGRGALLEEDRAPPEEVLEDGGLPEEVFRRWAKAEPGVKISADDRARLPAAFVALIERHGSVHWVPPEDYDGDFGWRNSGPSAFLALAWPESFDLSDFLVTMDRGLVERLRAAGVDQFTVFHDGLGEFAAFDARRRGPDGEPVVVEGFDEVTWINYVLEPERATNVKTFEVWLRERIEAVTAELKELEDD